MGIEIGLPRSAAEIRAFAYGVERGHRLDGYVTYIQNRRVADGRGVLHLTDLVALTPEAGRRLLTFFADHRSLVESVNWVGSPAEPLLLQAGEQEAKVADNVKWMLRVVHVKRALAGRGYPSGLRAEVQFDIQDDLLPGNRGRFVLSVSGGSGRVRKGGRGRVRIDVRGLAALYTGFLSAEELLATGLIYGDTSDLGEASAVFAGPTPWMVEMF